MSYTKLESETFLHNSSDEAFVVYLYPNTSSMDSVCENEVADAMDNVGSQLLNNDSCVSYEVWISYEHPGLTTSNRSDFWDAWTSYSGPNDRETRQGTHLCVGDADIGGLASNPTNPGAWNDSYDAVSGWTSPGYYTNITVMETLHPYIDHTLDAVDDLTATDDEHELGHVYLDGEATPLATGYPNDQESGGCQSTASVSAYTRDLNSCEMDALDATSESA